VNNDPEHTARRLECVSSKSASAIQYSEDMYQPSGVLAQAVNFRSMVRCEFAVVNVLWEDGKMLQLCVQWKMVLVFHRKGGR